MRIGTHRSLGVVILGMALSSAVQAQTVRIDGAATGHALNKAAVEEFQKLKKNAVQFTLGTSGSAGGLRKLCKGEIDLANASRPILKDEMAACQKAAVEFIEVPVAFDAITVVVNPKNTFVQGLTVEELKRMWEADAQGKIVRWSQVNPRFPNAPLKLLAPDSQFESVSTFNEVILGRGAKSRADYMASVDDNVLVQGVARDVNALAYVPYATFREHSAKLKAVPIAAGTPGADRALARLLFIYVNVKSLDHQAVREFVEFAVGNGGRLAKAKRYVPLADATYRLGIEHLRNRSKGSAWDGTIPVGLTSEELQKRQAAL